ncbi:MAG: hypothetical protein H6822_19765 [Planctomycetaceae bacterium]|nr:hypothetical protein [Planctomycetaceae bacterium]
MSICSPAAAYWDYYESLRQYRASPSTERAASLGLEFDELFASRTGYAALDARIAKTAAKKNELLTVLSEPSVPLHNNASELQARVSARRRDVSLHRLGQFRVWQPWDTVRSSPACGVA